MAKTQRQEEDTVLKGHVPTREIKSLAKISVVVRKRPLSQNEIKRGEQDIVDVIDDHTIVLHEPRMKVDTTRYTEHHEFKYDRAFDEHANNKEIYLGCVRPFVQAVYSANVKCSCFAYGQTGSGKTFTMLGPKPYGKCNKPGIFEFAAEDLFRQIRSQQNPLMQAVCVSFYEVYCGKLYDLLQNRKLVAALESGKKEVIVKDLKLERVYNKDELLAKMIEGVELRQSGANSVNHESSRSHAIMQIDLKSEDETISGGKLSFIDLAGSERGSDTLNGTRAMQDGVEINRSLLALKECIRAMDMESKHIPFRDSELTKVLRDIFVGKSHSIMISNISPTSSFCDPTLNTLRYSNRVKDFRQSNVKPKEVNERTSSTPLLDDDDDDYIDEAYYRSSRSLIEPIENNSTLLVSNLGVASNKSNFYKRESLKSNRQQAGNGSSFEDGDFEYSVHTDLSASSTVRDAPPNSAKSAVVASMRSTTSENAKKPAARGQAVYAAHRKFAKDPPREDADSLVPGASQIHQSVIQGGLSRLPSANSAKNSSIGFRSLQKPMSKSEQNTAKTAQKVKEVAPVVRGGLSNAEDQASLRPEDQDTSPTKNKVLKAKRFPMDTPFFKQNGSLQDNGITIYTPKSKAEIQSENLYRRKLLEPPNEIDEASHVKNRGGEAFNIPHISQGKSAHSLDSEDEGDEDGASSSPLRGVNNSASRIFGFNSHSSGANGEHPSNQPRGYIETRFSRGYETSVQAIFEDVSVTLPADASLKNMKSLVDPKAPAHPLDSVPLDDESLELYECLRLSPDKMRPESMIPLVCGSNKNLEEMPLSELSSYGQICYKSRHSRLKKLLQWLNSTDGKVIAASNYTERLGDELNDYIKERIEFEFERALKLRQTWMEAENFFELHQLIFAEYQSKSANGIRFSQNGTDEDLSPSEAELGDPLDSDY